MLKSKFIKEHDFDKLIVSCWVTLLAIWLYVAVSGNYLSIVVSNPKLIEICSFIDNNIILENLISFVMYFLNWILIIFTIFQKKLFKYKPILISLLIFSFWLIKAVFEDYNFINYVDFIFFGILAIMCKRKWYRAIIGAIYTFIFSLISSFVKQIFIINIDFNTVSSLIALVFSIDIYLMWFICYLTTINRKENEYGKMACFLQIRKKMEAYFCGIRNSISNFFSRNSSSSSLKETFYSKYCGVVFFFITYLSLLIIGIIFNRWIEMSISAIFFHLFRAKEEDTYHAKNDLICWCVSMLNFCIVMKLTLPIYISYIFSIVLAFVLCVIMRIVYFIVKPIKTKNKRKILIEIIGQMNTDNEEYIEKLCKEKGLSQKYSETIYLFLNNTIEETAQILEIDNKTVTRRIDKFIEGQS